MFRRRVAVSTGSKENNYKIRAIGESFFFISEEMGHQHLTPAGTNRKVCQTQPDCGKDIECDLIKSHEKGYVSPGKEVEFTRPGKSVTGNI